MGGKTNRYPGPKPSRWTYSSKTAMEYVLGKENMSDSLTWWIYKFLQFFLVTKQYERNLHNNSLK